MDFNGFWFLLLITVDFNPSSTVHHSLQYYHTAVKLGNFPEFTVVGDVDEGEFVYYDSNIRQVIPKTDWIKKNMDEDYWNKETQTHQRHQENIRVSVTEIMKPYNLTTGVNTAQLMFGCELNDNGTRTGYWQYGYNGKDFLSLDVKAETWIAPIPQAVITKQKWERTREAKSRKAYLENECINWLEKFVEYGRSILERKDAPEVSVFQKDSSSPVVCHATGFFPKEVMISWQKNGEDVEEEVEIRETLRNQDGSFQQRSILTVSPEKLDTDQYTCVVQHIALEKEMVLKVQDRRILSGGGIVGIIAGVIVVVLLAIIACVAVFILKKKSDFKPVSQAPSDADSSSNNSAEKA